jgi:hypothetical protein
MDTADNTDRIASLEREISALEQSDQARQDVNNDLSRLEKELSLLFIQRFQQTNSLDDVRAMHTHARAALGRYEGTEARQTLLANLANGLFLEYRITHDENLLNEAIDNFVKLFQLPFQTPEHEVSLCTNFWVLLKERVALEPTLECVQRSIDVLRSILEGEETSKHADPTMVRDLLAVYLIKYDLVDDYPDLNHAIKTAMLAIKIADVYDPNKEKCIFQHNLATFLNERFRRDAKPEDLTLSLSIWSVLVTAAREEQNAKELGESLNGLASAFHNKYLLTGNLDELQEAIKKAQEGLDVIATQGESDKEVEDALKINLSISLAARFETLGVLNDLDRAITLATATVQGQMEGSHDRLKYLNNLSTFHSLRYTTKGNVADLEKSIEIGRQLLQESVEGDYRREIYMGNLSTWLQDRYDATGALADLEEAIEFARRSISGGIPVQEDRLILQNNLCERLSRWYSRTKQLSSLEEAIRLMREVLENAGEYHPMMPRYRNNLSNYLTTRFNETHDLGDVTEAINLVKAALDRTTESTPDHADFWNNLGSHYHDKFGETLQKEDLNSSIDATRQAADLAKLDRPAGCYYYNNLGNLLLLRATKFTMEEDRKDAKESYRRAASYQNGHLITRIGASLVGGREYAKDGQLPIALDMLQKGVSLLSKVSPRSISREDRQHNLSGLSGISSIACSVALSAGLPADQCLHLLESGRAIISALSVRMNGDILMLEASPHTDLCSRYKDLRDRVWNISQIDHEYPGVGYADLKQNPGAVSVLAARKSTRRDNLALLEELDKVEQEIRGLPSFANFQLAPSGEQCMQMAQDGPIVYFNVTELRSDAILITASSISSMDLMELKYADLESNAKMLIGDDRITSSNYLSSKAERNKLLLRVLQWLWDTAVKPVLDRLGLLEQGGSRQSLPRVYWVASGAMGMMPMHAAGCHDPQSMENSISHVVSTYVTTLKALAQSRDAAKAKREVSEIRTLIVTMPTTASMKPIAAMEEAASLVKTFSRHGVTAPNIEKHPSKETLKSKLPNFNVAHFACHGNSNAINPSKGGLFLGREGETEAQHLSIAELSTMQLKNARLAYLSACSTAENLSGLLADEVIHTAGSFQLLGFQQVIGTFWEAGNKEALKVAEGFYDNWLGTSKGDWGGEFTGAVADALHRSILALRDEGIPRVRRTATDPRKDVISWAPFIHIGV